MPIANRLDRPKRPRGRHKSGQDHGWVLSLDPFAGTLSPDWSEAFPQAHEHAHDGDVDLKGAWTAEHARQHGHAFLGEYPRQILEVLAAL
jgi:hypothetical protein